MKKELKKVIKQYRKKDAAKDESAMSELLKEAQTMNGGALDEGVVKKIRKKLGAKRKFIKGVIKKTPELEVKKAKEAKDGKNGKSIKICDGKKCHSLDNAALQKHLQKEYGAKYKLCGCMHKCKDGPCVEVDGKVYTQMTPKKLDKLMGK